MFFLCFLGLYIKQTVFSNLWSWKDISNINWSLRPNSHWHSWLPIPSFLQSEFKTWKNHLFYTFFFLFIMTLRCCFFGCEMKSNQGKKSKATRNNKRGRRWENQLGHPDTLRGGHWERKCLYTSTSKALDWTRNTEGISGCLQPSLQKG